MPPRIQFKFKRIKLCISYLTVWLYQNFDWIYSRNLFRKCPIRWQRDLHNECTLNHRSYNRARGKASSLFSNTQQINQLLVMTWLNCHLFSYEQFICVQINYSYLIEVTVSVIHFIIFSILCAMHKSVKLINTFTVFVYLSFFLPTNS